MMAQALAKQENAQRASDAWNGASVTSEEDEARQKVDGWLRRIPDTPGHWLRYKFMSEHQRRREGGDQ